MHKYYIGIILLLLSYSNNKCMENDNPLIRAISHNNIVELCGALLTLPINQEDLSKALLYAAAYGRAKHIKLLIGAGAPINCKDPEGNTPVHLAVLYENSKTLQALIDGKAKALPSTGCCIAQLCHALYSALQIKKIPSLTIQNNSGKTAIEIALQNESTLVKLFPGDKVIDARNTSNQIAHHIHILKELAAGNNDPLDRDMERRIERLTAELINEYSRD